MSTPSPATGPCPDLLQDYARRILRSSVYAVAIQTPLQPARALSARLGNQVLLKREDLQPVHSFKIRGAYNKVSQINAEQKARGVISASAGNHAQGLALAAQYLGVAATIVMPRTAPELKILGVQAYGGTVLLHGDSFPEALAYALELAREQQLAFIAPYDDPDVIAGQATVAVEILNQQSGPLDAIFVPVGGGSLIAGVAAYVKYLRPEIKVIGVEPADSNCLQAALAAGERVVLPQVGLFADGVAVAQIGAHNFEICRHYVDEVITVSTDEICDAIKDIYDDTRSITEPAGALAVAGIKRYVVQHQWQGKTLVAIDSGANINFDRLRHVAERADLGSGREALLAVTLDEQPGALRAFCLALGKRPISEFNYRQSHGPARVFVGVQTHPQNDPAARVLSDLRGQGYEVLDLSDNELAKLHVRHTVGGLALERGKELVFRFEFPERPGALLQFLQRLGSRWNISLFHYRNHGAAHGRVLAALQVPDDERALVLPALDALGFAYSDESDNPAYQLFLG